MIDRIISYEKGKRLEALKALSLSEDYLADHFPSFPIMPGVLMLESMVQAAGWLLRLSDGFDHPVYVLRQVRAVRYGSIVRPGDELRIEVNLTAEGEEDASFAGSGTVEGRKAIVGRFVLKRQPLVALRPDLAAVEATIRCFFEEQCASLMECERRL
jgi:3-hydroxyacyl-[acyl-carrier-protein] dehydratase